LKLTATGSLTRHLSFLIIAALMLSAASCATRSGKLHRRDTVSIDLDSIRARGKLIALTDFNSTNYFLYRGEPMGFQYEMLQALSKHLGVGIEIVTENRIDKAIDMLHTGRADILAMNLAVTPPREKEIRFTEPISQTRHVLVQRKPDGWNEISAGEVENSLIREPSGLKGRTIYVQEHSSHAWYLRSLTKETGRAFSVKEFPFESEELIQLVDNGAIELAVCDEDIALVNSTYYPAIDVNTPLGPVHEVSWGVRKTHSDQLLAAIDEWIVSFRKTNTYALLYAKYFRNPRSGAIAKSNYFTLTTGRISPYDDLIKTYSDTIGWDWRLLASLICQESRFNPHVRSRVGAYGLMQIMPRTGKNFGIDITSSPGNNIYAGVKYINWLHSIFDPKIPDVHERVRFILAAYNAGPGHILDAMNLAAKFGYDPLVWKDNVEKWLQKKSESKYYSDSSVKNGYFRGIESVAFVNEILERYEHYRNIVSENKYAISSSGTANWPGRRQF